MAPRPDHRRLNVPPLPELLSYCRPHGSDAEHAFVHRYVTTLPGAWTDAHGNVHVRIGAPTILWSCHTDTVHRTGGRQNVRRVDGYLKLTDGSKSACLGGDDTVGVYICLALIAAGRDGHYLFHRGEECGGIGSTALARYSPHLLNGTNFAIALDRAGTRDIVTSQCGQPCCSEAFAESLSAALSPTFKQKRRYQAEAGTYTDTHEYRQLIPECTNLSVGYAHAHTSNESVDLRHVHELIHALQQLDTARLSCVRRPTDPDEDPLEYALGLRYVLREPRSHKGRCYGWKREEDDQRSTLFKRVYPRALL